MATKKKLLQAAAGQAGGAGLNVEDVFSTYLYDGNSSTQTITNDIDLSGEGGLVWIKGRSDYGHHWTDTERGATKTIFSDETEGQLTLSTALTSFNSSGFSIGSLTQINNNNSPFASWTFRKAPKFFDVVTYTGDGTDNHTISHNLGTDIGTIMIKCTSHTSNWVTWHRTFTQSGNSSQFIYLNSTGALASDTNIFNGFSTTNFTVGGNGAGASDFNTHVNTNGRTYVAYLFAHNDGDGDFGDGTQDIIKCGSYTGNATDGKSVTLGFEPQWILFRNADTSENWRIFDVMRGISNPYPDPYLDANLSTAETSFATTNYVNVTPTGFTVGSNPSVNGNNQNIIYIAIRRGPMAVPTAATDVFGVDAYSGNSTAGRIISSGFPVDLAIVQSRSAAGDTNAVADRLRGANVLLNTPNSHAELTNNSQSITGFDFMDGIEIGTDTRVNWSSGTYVSWMWKRAPNYFDVVAWSGDGTGSARIIPHNLTVEPEMIISKPRNAVSGWSVYVKDLWTSGSYLSMELNTTAAASSNGSIPNSSVHRYPFRTGDPNAGDNITNFCAQGLNSSGETYIAYLFASLDGVSKVGSFTNVNGQTTNVDCGFSSGARFVIIKRYNSAEEWMVFDTTRGIVAGDDARLQLNSTAAENNGDYIDPYSSGFSTGADLNSGDYIFYAIA